MMIIRTNLTRDAVAKISTPGRQVLNAVDRTCDVHAWKCDEEGKPRTHAHRFNVTLTGNSNRGRNSGRWGADDSWEYGPPATWDEHGDWMAQLYAQDPTAVIQGSYKNAEDFTAKTKGAYPIPATTVA